MDKRLNIHSVWLKRNIGKNYQISIPNNYKELYLKEGCTTYSDMITKYIVISNVQGEYEDVKVVLYSIWKKMNKDENKVELDINSRIKNDTKQYKFELISEDKFFVFVLIVAENEQYLVEFSSLAKEKDEATKEFNSVINSIKRKRREEYGN